MALSKHFKRINLPQKIFELHAWVKKCHFDNFSERADAEMAVPCQCGPQKCIIAFEKFLLFWVPINIKKDWMAKLESDYSFILKHSKITVWQDNFKGPDDYQSSFKLAHDQMSMGVPLF